MTEQSQSTKFLREDGTWAAPSYTQSGGDVTGPSSSTDAHVAVFNGTTGKVINDSGFTIGKSVPSDAVFTDTVSTFYASAGTTFDAIKSAYSAGKTVIYYTPTAGAGVEVYYLSYAKKLGDPTPTEFTFTRTSGSTTYWTKIDSSNTWSSGSTSYAGTSSPAFTGTPTAPTAAAGTNTTQIATTAFVASAYSNKAASSGGTDVSLVTTGEKYTWDNKQSKVSALGSTTSPVYTSAAGTFATCSTYAGGTRVTLNGTSKAASTASFYAPTSYGTTGYYLKANGSGAAPTWASFPTIPSVTLNGSSTSSPSFYAPTSAGTSGYYLKSNGSGAPTWTAFPTIPSKMSDVASISVTAISADTSSSCSITGSANAGKSQTIIYTNSSGSDKTVTVPTTYSTPDGAAIELTCPNGGYCEVNYLNVGGTIYARGL